MSEVEIIQIINDIFPDFEIREKFLYMCSQISSGKKIEKPYYWYGKCNTGKTTIKKLLQSILGKDSVNYVYSMNEDSINYVYSMNEKIIKKYKKSKLVFYDDYDYDFLRDNSNIDYIPNIVYISEKPPTIVSNLEILEFKTQFGTDIPIVKSIYNNIKNINDPFLSLGIVSNLILRMIIRKINSDNRLYRDINNVIFSYF